MSTAVTAVVLAGRGGARLGRTLDSVAWARERLVLDPARRLAAEVLPARVRRVADEEGLAAAGEPWVLLLAEDDVVPPALAEVVGAVAGGRGTADAYRIPQEVEAFGGRFCPRRAPVRLARAGSRLALGGALGVELAWSGERCWRVAAALRTSFAASLAEMVNDLEADAAALAALWRARGTPARAWNLVRPPLAAALRMFSAPAAVPAPWARWSLAVVVGYRAMAAHAMLWELARQGTRA